ncbi:unnamed protein product [Pelagomonas calceolata]|uniref:Uncharacterized protein n=1 Tax=Pelagomonas calceolata TaxID=35677 RepID=A0A8J2SRM0_9STRA|nr:unnamed protein product [Pelagomonas calceolata]
MAPSKKPEKPRMVIRLLMIGDSSVGKTSLVVRYDEDSFSATPRTMFMTTIGVDYRDKLVKIEGRDIKLQIWDTAGQERFRSLTSNFFGRADGFAVCFDVGARASFNHVRQWLDDVEKNKKGPVELCLIGCKCDLAAEKRQVSKAEAEKLAGEKGLPYFEASAKTNQNVAEAFEDLAARVLRKKAPSSDDVVRLADEAPTRRSRCCN